MKYVVRAAGFALFLSTSFHLAAETPSAFHNSEPAYVQLRNLALGGESVSVNDFVLKRDAAKFHLRSGTVCFVAPVQGKVTGAVFVGDGTMNLDPPLAVERSSLKLLTKGDEFSESFSQAVFRFTDSTYEELKKAGGTSSGGCDANPLHESQDAMRRDHMLRWNLESRILQDVLGSEPGGFFLAFIRGKNYDSKEIYAIDPHGAPPLVSMVSPEEVEFLTYNENRIGVWAAFHLTDEYKKGIAVGSQKSASIHIGQQQLDTTIEKNAELSGKSITTFVSEVNGLRVVPFDLFRTLRVSDVTGEKGEQLFFIQEDKNQDANFSVILPKALARGDTYTVTTTYDGKEAVINEGGGNYYPVARENWYPNNANSSLGEYTAYDMIFRVPKGMKIAATGQLISEKVDSGDSLSVWRSTPPRAAVARPR